MTIYIKLLLAIFIFAGCTQTNHSVQQYDPGINSSNNTTNGNKNESALFSSPKEVESSISIGIVFPSYTIGKYALEATNSINTYLIDKNQRFDLKVYDIIVQNKKNLITVVEKLKDDNISKVIAMITKEDLKDLNQIYGINKIQFYLPLINKNDIVNKDDISNLNVVYGAISYKDQFKKLIEYANNKPLVEFYGNSGIGRTLHDYLKDDNITYTKRINDEN